MDDPFERYRDALKQGHLAAMQGKPKDALKFYETAAKLAPERPLPHVSMGGILLRMGKTKDALAAYGRAVERAPRDIDALSGQAAAHLAAGRRDESARILERVSRIKRGLPDGPEQAGAAAELTPAEHLHVTAETARVQGNVPAAVDALLGEADIHARTGHLDAALDACQEALALASGAPRVHLELATLYFMRGWTELAVDHVLLLSRLLDLEPEPGVQEGVMHLAAEHVASDSRLAGLASLSPPATPAPGAPPPG